MLPVDFLCGTRRLFVGDIYSSSIEQIFITTCSGGDMAFFLGCNFYLFNSNILEDELKAVWYSFQHFAFDD